jgi:predicted transcriptional regulator
MPKYNTKLIGTKNIGKAVKKTYQVTKKGNLKSEHIKDILATISKGNTDVKIMIRALNADKWNTLKGFSTELNIEDFEDYYKNKVSDTSKFEYFTQVEVSILT